MLINQACKWKHRAASFQYRLHHDGCARWVLCATGSEKRYVWCPPSASYRRRRCHHWTVLFCW